MIPKFKAFLKDTKQTVDVAMIFFDNEVIRTENNDFYLFEDIILMQSTGLYDKNGVEIFEGDVININHTFRNSMTGSGTLTLNKNFEVIIVNGMFTRDGSSMGLNKDLKYLTVIGNVHQNPELLGE